MKYFRKILCLLSITILFGSCSMGVYHYTTDKSTSFSPDIVRLDLTVDDFEYLGETTISADYRFYFGLFYHIDSINEVPYDRRRIEMVDLSGHKDIRLSPIMNNATYKAMETFPNADYYMTSKKQKEITKLFLGQIVKEKVTLRAYKFKIH